MSFNTFGKIFRFTTWGESHGPAIGCVVDGCPPNIKINIDEIQKDLNKRKPGQSKFTTQRKEDDRVEILSGIFEGKTTGTPISMIIYNKDMRSKDYGNIKNKFRPGHADFTYFEKFIKKNQLFCPDKSVLKLWEKYLLSIRKAGSSCGAIIEIRAKGVPVGLGAPIYSKLDMDLASAMMSINAVKGVNIGSGMNSAQLTGEENSDEINQRGKSTKFNSNNAGGILGGISSGQDIIVSFAVKPTSSILSTRKTIDKFGKNTTISVKGRHDPCVGIRAVPIGEAMMHCVILDHYLLNKAQCGN